MKKIFIILTLSAGVTFASCSDFLTQNPYNEVGENVAITNYNNARYALNAVYYTMRSSSFYGRNVLTIADAATENTMLSPQGTVRFNDICPWTISENTSLIGSVFSSGYSAINAINRIFAVVDKIDATDAQKREIKGQVLALRALCHFEIARLFCQAYSGGENSLGIPYMEESTVFGKPDRGALSNTYSKIIVDFKEAILLLTNRPGFIAANFPAVYYLDEWSAKALLARVYLSQLDYTNAKPLLQDIVSNSGYMLLPNANFLNAWAEKYSSTSKTEFMLAMNVIPTETLGSESIGFTYLQGGYNDLRAAQNAFDLFDDEDIRKSLFLPGTGGAIGYIMVNKYISRESNTGLTDIPIVRLADVYLMYAEACAYTGDETTAITYLDKVRLRAQPFANISTETGEALKEKIFLERRKELMYEGHYLHDLKRYQKPIISATRSDHAHYMTVPYPSNLRAYPIPRHEMDANPNMEQNPR